MNQLALHNQPVILSGVTSSIAGITRPDTTPITVVNSHNATNKLQNKENNMSYLDNILEIVPASGDIESELESVRTLVDDIGQQLEDKAREIESVKEQIDSDFSAAEDAISLLVDVISKLETLDVAIEEIESLDIDISI